MGDQTASEMPNSSEVSAGLSTQPVNKKLLKSRSYKYFFGNHHDHTRPM